MRGRVTVAIVVALLTCAGCGSHDGDAVASPQPTDPLRSQQWSLDQLDPAENAWPVTQGQGVTVAVIDSGVTPDHPDLDGRVLPGLDLVDPDVPSSDGYGHGTHVAGIIAATPGNDVAMAGMAPKVHILPVRVLDQDGSGSYGRTAEGIRWAVDQGAQVINLSLTLSADDAQVRSAIAYAMKRNVVVVAAAGNQACPSTGTNDTTYPAAYPGVIGVGATGEQRTVSSFSSCGPWVDVVAPGFAIISITSPGARKPECQDDKGWCILSGTSEAAPFVSAAAALRIAQVGVDDYDAAEISQQIIDTAHDLPPTGRDDRSGHGLLDLAALLSSE